MENCEDSARIVRVLVRHDGGSAYSGSQIAFHAFDKGSSENASKVGRAVYTFATYFGQIA